MIRALYERYLLGQNLVKSVITYMGISAFVIVAFNMIANAIVATL